MLQIVTFWQHFQNAQKQHRTESSAKLILCLKHYTFQVLWENIWGKKCLYKSYSFPRWRNIWIMCLIYRRALPLIIPCTSQPGGTTLAMRWALAGFTAVRMKAASQPALPSPGSLQEKSPVRVGHRETDWGGLLVPCGSQPCPLLTYKLTPHEPPGICSPAARKLSLAL